MLIECTIRRQNGSTSTMEVSNKGKMEDIKYRFVPTDKNGKPVPNTRTEPNAYLEHPHICDVQIVRHMRRLLECPGYQPYGEKAEQEAREKFGWGEEDEVPDSDEVVGQPEVVTEMIDEEGGVESIETEGQESAAEDTADWSDEDWIAWASELPGLEDPANKDQLETYVKENYGVDLDKRKGITKLLKEVYTLANAE